MQAKLFEVRDRLTFLPVLAVRLSADGGDGYLLRRCGYVDGRGVMLTRLNGGTMATADVYQWGDRTMQTAANYIEEHFDQLEDGAVVDVEFLLGETETPKRSERHYR